ncbi:protein of unknown function [Aminobacter niigataensis]|nr:protein of unknown function [Aminobacter niigataensis]
MRKSEIFVAKLSKIVPIETLQVCSSIIAQPYFLRTSIAGCNGTHSYNHATFTVNERTQVC